MSWLYKFLLDVIEKKDFCTQCHCTTCGATEFRATLISKLKIYRRTDITLRRIKKRFPGTKIFIC